MRAPFLALALVLVMAAPAYAGSPDSNITTPGGTTFLMDDGNDTLLIAGHSTFSPIDIICTYGPDDQQVLSVNSSLAYHDIAQQSGTGGDFSATLPLEPLRYQDCVLRAIPAGTADDDPDLSTASGPTLSVGYRHADADPFNYDLQLAPLGGSAEFGQSSYYGGIQSTYALNPTDLSFVRLFSLSDSLVVPSLAETFRLEKLGPAVRYGFTRPVFATVMTRFRLKPRSDVLASTPVPLRPCTPKRV